MNLTFNRSRINSEAYSVRLTREQYERLIAEAVASELSGVSLDADGIGYRVSFDRRDTGTGFEHWAYVTITLDYTQMPTAAQEAP